ncbi:MAG: DUF2868 domain-containing protein [Deltaproteobacteria bacterium]|nr:DUF2868 domain-containing protein [Deltaproteobacteria bacterium]
MALTEAEAAAILLIRSVEEADQKILPEQMLRDADTEGGHEIREAKWLVKRSAYLMARLPSAYHAILPLSKLPGSWLFPACVAAFILGIGTNLVGRTDKIHVIRNPVLAFVLWNLCVYLGLLLLFLRSKLRRHALSRSKAVTSGDGSSNSSQNLAGLQLPRPKVPWILKSAVFNIWNVPHKLNPIYRHSRAFVATAKLFWSHWLAVADQLVIARWKRLLHLCAASLAVGAVAGMYFQGLFQGYRVVWDSTFITNQASVNSFVNLIFAPAVFLSEGLGLDAWSSVETGRLLSPEGHPAEPWIHLFAFTVVIFIVLPRAALATWHSVRIQRHIKDLLLNFDKYFEDIIERRIKVRIERQIETAVTKLSESITSFVCENLYDRRIVPTLEKFRQNGGSIAGLRTATREITEAFAPEIKAYVTDQAIPEFRLSVANGVRELVKSIETDFVGVKSPEQPLREMGLATPDLTIDIGHSYADAISAAIGLSIAMVFGTVSGGFGSSLETAIITTLLGTTGPIGFVIGALIGIVVAGAGWWYGRETITGWIESVELPAMVVRSSLWESRFRTLVEDGRKQFCESVRARVDKQLKVLAPEITEEVVQTVRAIL